MAFLRKSIFVPLCLYVIYSLSPQKIKRQFTNNTIPMLTVPCCTFHLAACRCTAQWPTKPCELVAILFPVIIFIACFHATRRPGERFALKFNYCHLVVSSPRSCFFISTRPLPFQGNLLSPPRVYWLDGDCPPLRLIKSKKSGQVSRSKSALAFVSIQPINIILVIASFFN